MKDCRADGTVFECLEPRLLLSGNVAVTVSGGNLHINGDAQNNEIEIVQVDDDSFEIVGTDTTVNGDASQTFDSVSGNISVHLRGGDDSITMDSGDIPGSIVVRMGGGDDAVTVTDSSTGGSAKFKGRRGDDTITITGCDIGGMAVARGGHGDNTLTYIGNTDGGFKEKGIGSDNLNAPVFTSSTTRSVAENTTAVGTITATDADLPAQTVTYSIAGGADSARFTINATTGALSFLAAPNYEAPTDANTDNVYLVQVTANDGNGGTTTQSISVTITAVEDNAPVFTSSATPSIPENTTAVVTVAATDADLPAQTVTYSITGGADAALFTINAATGALAFIAAPNYEAPTDADTNNVYLVQVTANSGTGSLTTQDLSITVTDVVEP